MAKWNGLDLKSVDKPVEKVDNSLNSNIFNHSGPVIGLFAKEPVAGRVKTRLSPALTAEQACCLYQTSLCETVNRLLAAELPEFADATELDLRFAGQGILRNEPLPEGAEQAAAARGYAPPST